MGRPPLRYYSRQLVVVGAESKTLDGLAGCFATRRVPSAEALLVGGWGADECAVLVSGCGLQSTLGLGGYTCWHVSRALLDDHPGAFGGAEVALDALDLDSLLVRQASIWLWVLVVGAVGHCGEELRVDGQRHHLLWCRGHESDGSESEHDLHHHLFS